MGLSPVCFLHGPSSPQLTGSGPWKPRTQVDTAWCLAQRPSRQSGEILPQQHRTTGTGHGERRLRPSRRRWRRWEWRCLSRGTGYTLNREGNENLVFVCFDRVMDGLGCHLIPEFSDAAGTEESEATSCSWPPGASILPRTCTCACSVSFKV